MTACALAMLVIVTPVNAEPGRHFQTRFVGAQATAIWHYRTATTDVVAVIDALDGTIVVTGEAPTSGPTGFVLVLVSNLDGGGNVTRSIQYDGFADPQGASQYSMTVDGRLLNASVSWTDVPVERCTLDAQGSIIECTDTTIDADVMWVGDGPIEHTTEITHSSDLGSISHETLIVRHRLAVASGVIAGIELPADANIFGVLRAPSVDATSFVCTGRFC